MDKKPDILLNNKASILSLKTNNKTDTKTSPKEGMSLFDQLLNDTKKSISLQKELNNTSNNKINKKVDKLEHEVLNTKNIGSSSSFLDKLIFETKEKISLNEKIEKKEIKSTDNLSSSKIVKSHKGTNTEIKNIDQKTENNLNNKTDETTKTDTLKNKSNENIKTETISNKTITDNPININKKSDKNESSEVNIENLKNKKNVNPSDDIKKNPNINDNTQKNENNLKKELDIKSTNSLISVITNKSVEGSSTSVKDDIKSNTTSIKTIENVIKVDSKSTSMKEVFSDIKNEHKDEKIEINSKELNNKPTTLEKNIPSVLENDEITVSVKKNEGQTSAGSSVLSNENTKDLKVQVSEPLSVSRNINNGLDELTNTKDIKKDIKIVKDEKLIQENPKKEILNDKSQKLKEDIGINFKDKNNASETILKNDTKDTILQNNNNLKVNDTNSNKKAANEFAKLSTSDLPLEKIKINKEYILNKTNTSSLKNDQKIENNLEKNSEKVSFISEKIDVKASKESLLSNIFLSSQQRVVSRQEMQTLSENKKSILEDKSIVTLKTVAKDLELDLKEVKMDSKKSEKKVLSKELVLDKLAFSKNILKTNIENILGTVNSNIIENELNDLPDVTLNVSGLTLHSLETKIISAKQNVSSLMSDIAKKMYENYKPPVTAFRMLLNPSTLGSISVIMKHDKENGLSISLNMSSQNTLEVMNENESTLRSALSKTFLDESEFSLDFNMQGDSRNQEKEEKQKHARNSTNEILESLSNNINAEPLENNQNYM